MSAGQGRAATRWGVGQTISASTYAASGPDGLTPTLTVRHDRAEVRELPARPMHRTRVGLFPPIAKGCESHGVAGELPGRPFALSHWKEYARIVGPSAPVPQ